MDLEIDAFVHSNWLAGLRKHFATADIDRDGRVDASDLRRSLAALGLAVTDDWAARQIAQYDRDGDGHVSFPDYAAGMALAHRELQPAARALSRAFDAVDTDGDGRISVQELSASYRQRGVSLTSTQVADRIHRWDNDGDGRIDLAELVHMLVS